MMMNKSINAIAILSFAIMATFVYGIPSAATLPRWFIIALCPLVVLSMPPSRWTVPHLIGLLALIWSAISLLWTSNRFDGLGELMQWIFLVAVFGIGMRSPSIRPIYIGAGLGIWLSGIFVLIELFYQDGILKPFILQYTGLFINPNMLAEVSVLVLIGALVHRLWWLVPGILPSVIIPHSRGAVLAGVVAFGYWLWSRSRLMVGGLAIIAIIAAFAMWFFGFKSLDDAQRIGLTLDNLQELTFWGRGIGSYNTSFPYTATHIDVVGQYPEYAHNDFLQLWIELGPGTLLFAGMLYLCFQCAGEAERLVLIAFTTEAMFGYPLHMPATAFMAAIVMGHACRNRRDLWDDLRHWGVLLYPRFQRTGRNG